MTAHILNPRLDPKYPATLSVATIDGLLRKSLRFSRLVFADDMEMKAITDHFGAEQAAVLAIKAGCDCLIYRAEQDLPVRQIEAVMKAVETKELSLETVERAVARSRSSKATYCDLSKPVEVTEVGKFIGLPEHFHLAEMITKKEIPTGIEHSEDF